MGMAEQKSPINMPLRVEELVFSYGTKPFFSSLSFELLAGTITCLVGGNGAGKTTLFNIISGYLSAQSGQIIIQGRDLTHADPYQISNAGLSRTFQDLRLIPSMSVQDNIRLACRKQPSETLARALLPQILFRQSEKQQEQKTAELLSSYQLRDVAKQRADSISFGQQKLLTLACCEATGGAIFLLDEPAAGIHREYRGAIIERIRCLAKSGQTILLIEHQTDILQALGEQFLLLRDGRVSLHQSFAKMALAQE